MGNFQPIRKKPGEIIRSEDWNKIQDNVKVDLESLEEDIRRLRQYVDSLAKSVTLTNLDSPVGRSYNLDEVIPGEVGSYSTRVLGYITKQWMLGKVAGEICKFGVLDYFDLLFYWAGAEKSDAPCLEIVIEYVDGSIYTEPNVMLNDWTQLQVKNQQNPYEEYLLAPNERVWYKYSIRNPNPDKEVRYVSFNDIDENNSPRIANVIQHVARMRPV